MTASVSAPVTTGPVEHGLTSAEAIEAGMASKADGFTEGGNWIHLPVAGS